MKRVCLIGLLALLAAPSPSWPGAFICDLPAGSDNFSDSEGVGRIPVPGIPEGLPFAVCGPTTITRDVPTPRDSTGSCTIPTEIVSMTLTGVFDPCGVLTGSGHPITITEDPADASTGEIRSDPTGGLPGMSFFDVYTLVDIPDLSIFGLDHDVHLEEDSLDAVPPGAPTPGGPECIEPGEDVYDDSAPGVPPSHAHIPCPQKLCCALFCPNSGQFVYLHLSPAACEILHGQPFEGDCPFLCPGQEPTAVEPRSWGSVKGIYR